MRRGKMKLLFDIHSKGQYPANSLSNFANHHFVLDQVPVSCMEGLLQSLKAPLQDQSTVCQMDGHTAKKYGSAIPWRVLAFSGSGLWRAGWSERWLCSGAAWHRPQTALAFHWQTEKISDMPHYSGICCPSLPRAKTRTKKNKKKITKGQNSSKKLRSRNCNTFESSLFTETKSCSSVPMKTELSLHPLAAEIICQEYQSYCKGKDSRFLARMYVTIRDKKAVTTLFERMGQVSAGRLQDIGNTWQNLALRMIIEDGAWIRCILGRHWKQWKTYSGLFQTQKMRHVYETSVTCNCDKVDQKMKSDEIRAAAIFVRFIASVSVLSSTG